MSKWLTNPNLTPAHDFKCDDAAVGTWMASGWEVREDQTDPVENPDVLLPALSASDLLHVTSPTDAAPAGAEQAAAGEPAED
jgi:hypothetical protein